MLKSNWTTLAILMCLILLCPSSLLAETKPKGKQIQLDVDEFDNNLSSTDTTVQKALETLDELDATQDNLSDNSSTELLDTTDIMYKEDYNTIAELESLVGVDIITSTEQGGSDASDITYENNASYDTVEEALDALFYVTPDVSGFSNNVGSVEIGSTITSVVLNWSLNKTMTSASINQSIGSVLGVLTYTHSTSFTTDRTYTITVSDGTNSDSASTAIYFRSKRYWGTNANTSLDSTAILALSGELSTSKTKSWSQNGNGQYIYYVYPASFGTATFTVNGLLSTSWTLSVQSHTNASGYSSSYNVYRTNNVQNGTGIQIEVS